MKNSAANIKIVFVIMGLMVGFSHQASVQKICKTIKTIWNPSLSDFTGEGGFAV